MPAPHLRRTTDTTDTTGPTGSPGPARPPAAPVPPGRDEPVLTGAFLTGAVLVRGPVTGRRQPDRGTPADRP
jgi:hypothetical protein